MKKLSYSLSFITLGYALLTCSTSFASGSYQAQPTYESKTTQETQQIERRVNETAKFKTAVFAGGCFWCIEADFEKVDGVQSVISGYTGGSKDTADYKTVTYNETGHYEAVEVSYDSSVVSYAELVEYFWRHIDPTNPRGQFCDSGSSYLSAIFYATEEEQEIVAASFKNLQENKPFEGDIVTHLKAATPFYVGEEYHQDYYKKNPIRYNLYRRGCRRDQRVNELWGSKK